MQITINSTFASRPEETVLPAPALVLSICDMPSAGLWFTVKGIAAPGRYTLVKLAGFARLAITVGRNILRRIVKRNFLRCDRKETKNTVPESCFRILRL
ncbi:MAG: hypothetical protein PHS41_13325 [Victivallaceae bacterium]|nr:hypothetical protein [Victivallaceae bacterium]